MRFRTRKDGTVYPISGSPGKKKAGAVVAGAAVAGAALFGIEGGAVGGSVASDGLSAAAQVRVANAQKAASRGQRGQAWKRVRAKEKPRKYRPQRHLDCVRNSHGQVRVFFAATPCRSLDRALTLLADPAGNTFVLSVYWVRMRNAAAARELKELDDTYGTGNVNPIASRLLGLAGVTFSGKYYDSRRRGSLVVIAEAEPVAGTPGPETLESVAQVATYLPPP